jgi:hypothetical protein
VLRKHGVSVACKVHFNGTEEWWLTRESGEFPRCGDPEGCGCDATGCGAEELRVAYMVVMASRGPGDRRYRVGFAALSAAAVGTVLRGVCATEPASFVSHATPSGVERLVTGLRDGFWSSGALCGCGRVETGLCDGCKVEERRLCTFLVSERYRGVYPRGRGHWFVGVSSALEGAEADGECAWLRCGAT